MVFFSSADFAFPLLSHEKALRLVALLDFKWVDIGLFQDRSHIQPSDQLDDPDRKGTNLKKMVTEIGLGISDIFFQSALDFKARAINHPDKAIRSKQRDIYDRLLEYTQAAGCRHISALPGVDFETPDSFEICRDELAWRVEKAAVAGITYGVEAHIGSIMTTPELAIKMLNAVPGLSLTLDHSHFTWQGIGSEQVKPLVPYASHIHARGAAKGIMQAAVADNTTDFTLVAQHCRESAYKGGICIEYTYTDWENCNQTDNISESLLMRDKLSSLFS
ncbi:sugar phosphate isomerase/epimerase [Treponema sp. TIM-1]|uniref:sugar phosphate isomerase/epimerase family protein n=1 Tax=Treponema sp. TIM-1 TaxID=2898417 RepID=UPI003981708F